MFGLGTGMLIIIGAAAAVFFWGVAAYNNFVRLVQQTKEAWADIDVQLKRRYDLIPNLVETVKGYAGHERDTLEAVVNARAAATQVHVDPSNITPEQIQAMAGAEQALGGALGKLLAIVGNMFGFTAMEYFELEEGSEERENVKVDFGATPVA